MPRNVIIDFNDWANISLTHHEDAEGEFYSISVSYTVSVDGSDIHRTRRISSRALSPRPQTLAQFIASVIRAVKQADNF